MASGWLALAAGGLRRTVPGAAERAQMVSGMGVGAVAHWVRCLVR